MRFCSWFVFLNAVLGLVGQARAQDSLLYANNAIALTQPASSSAPAVSKWRLSGYGGYLQLGQKGYLDQNLYLTKGVHASLTADYFLGRHWGLGVMLGYQRLSVSDEYRKDPSIPKIPTPLILPLSGFHSFMLTVGPALSLPLGPRFTLDIDLRGGLFYNDAPILGAYYFNPPLDDLNSGTLATSIMPSSQRARWGLSALVGPKYRISERLNLGLAVNGSYTSVNYTELGSTNFFAQKRLDLRMYGVQLGLSYRFSPVSATRPKAAPAVPPTPICYPPILDPGQRDRYEASAPDRPLFKWRSSAPVYTEGEQYTFRLYTLPGNRLVHEQVIATPQLAWPAQLALPDSNSYYYYSIFTSRKDEFEQACRSEPIVGTIGFLKAQNERSGVPSEPVVSSQWTVELIEQYKPVAQKAPPTETGRAPYRPAPGAASRPSATAGSAIPASRAYYRATVQQPDSFWPLDAPLPQKETVFRYRVRQQGNPTGSSDNLLLVGPDGSVAVITEKEMKDFFDRKTEPPSGPKPRSVTPATRKK